MMVAERVEGGGWKVEESRTALRATLYLLLSTLSVATATGCEAAGAIHYKLAGPPAVEARYVPAKEPMLVLVENYKATTTGFSDAEALARHLFLELKGHDVAPLVPMDKLYALRTDKGEAYRKMSMAAVGREVGAKQVLYVDVQQSSIGAPPGSELMKGRIAVQVRVVDVATGATRWPNGATEGIPLAYETPLPRADETATEAIIRQRMTSGMAIRIGRLFYKWKPVDTSEQLDMGEAG
jgi:hypothetical protein